MRTKDEEDQNLWHRRLGGASLASAVVAAASTEGEQQQQQRWVTADDGGTKALASLASAACSLLRDAEPRVRHAAAALLGALAAASTKKRAEREEGEEGSEPAPSSSSSSPSSFPPVWLLGARDAIFDIIERDWDRDDDEGGGKEGAKDGGPVAAADGGDGVDAPGDGLPPSLSSSSPPSSLIDAALTAAYARQRPGKGELRHGSEGWRCLETAFVALLSVVDGCGEGFAPVARSSPELRALVLRSLLHPNRFVREAGYGMLGGLCALAGRAGELDRWGAGNGKSAVSSTSSSSSSPSFADAAAAALADGLSENWSQVRLAACVAARSLLAAAAADDKVNKREKSGNEILSSSSTPSPSPSSSSSSSSSLHSRLLARLLPPLAFNRYDAAEGVRHYSNETWLLHTRGQGRRWVGEQAKEVFGYYLRCSRANNHMVRESAAVCVGELFGKVGGGESGSQEKGDEGEEKNKGERKTTSSPSSSSSSSSSLRCLVPRALQLLLSAARDDAWPVRDEGGRALAGLLAAFPEEVLAASAASSSSSSSSAAVKKVEPSPSPSPSASPSSPPLLDSLISIWRANLEDNVPSVRDGAAVSFVDALEGLLKKAKEGEGGRGERNGPVVAAALRLSAAIEETARERLPRAREQPAGECAGAPSAAPLQIQQAPTAAPGRSYRPFLDAKAPAAGVFSTAGNENENSLFTPTDLLSRRRDTGGVDFSCGCMDYGFRRPVEPWEQSDGAARLLREWSRVEGGGGGGAAGGANGGRGGAAGGGKALAFAEQLADAALQKHFAASSALRETVWSSLPVIARNTGMRAFKGSGALELFLGPLVDCLEAGGGEWRRNGGSGSDSARSVAAAGAALGALRDAMGPRIFAGRLDERQRRVVEASAEVPPPAGLFVVGGVGGGGARGSGSGGGSESLLLRGSGGVGAFVGAPSPVSSSSFPLPLGAGARPEGYCPGGMPLRK